MWTIRPATESDVNFIANSYLKSYRKAPEARPMINEVYYPEYKTRLEHMLRTGAVLVACAPEDGEQILGYIIIGQVGQYPILHYVYVKKTFRQFGVSKALLQAAIPEAGQGVIIVTTHKPRQWEKNRDKYSLIYDPKYSKELT